MVFTSQDFSTVFDTLYFNLLGDTVAIITTQMVDKDAPFSVPDSTVKTATFRMTYHMQPGYQNRGAVRYKDRRYAPGLGIITETTDSYYPVPGYKERRLVCYHLQ